ncbi:hypothetical protein LLEC1_07540, partial [Akanthomyces lecanii]
MPKQHALLLLRGSITFLLRHLLRQLAPSGLEDLYYEIDHLTLQAGKIDTLKTVLSTLETMPKQHALLLLRGSITFLLRHLLRQLAPSGLEDLYYEINRLTL